MKLKSKLFTSAVAFAMVLSMVAVPAAAQTTAELSAQIASLLAQINQLQAQIAGGTTGAGTTFTSDLTVGSKGAEVTALQQFLVSKGFLTMPAGVAMGYFGTLTKSALSAYQTSVGISPAVGYFGPITRAKVNALAVVPVTPGTVVPPGAITTPGAEGTISATESSSGTVSTVYEGDTAAPILGIKIEATGSDMSVQRIKFDLDETTGSDTKFYNKAYKKLYVTEGGNVLASIDLNSSTVTKDGTDYFVTIAGFNSVIPKGSSKTYLIKADAQTSIDTTDAALTYTIAVATNGVRAVDGAGIDQYTGTTAIIASPDIAASLVESATLLVSTNVSTPKKTDVVCSGGSSENECDKLTVLVMDIKAEKDAVKITDLRVQIDESTDGTAEAPNIYIYDGSTELDSASKTDSTKDYATFSDLDYVVPKDTTKTLTVKVDIRTADGTRTAFTAAASSTDFTTENTLGDSVTESGTATGNALGVLNAGPEFTLVSKSIVTAGVPQTNDGVAGYSTSTLTATFNVKVKAVGAALEFGTSQSTTTPMFASTSVPGVPSAGATYATKSFTVYINGSATTSIHSNATTTGFTIPSSLCIAGTLTNGCTLSEGNEVTVPVSFQIEGRTSAIPLTSGLYAIGINAINWVNPTAGKTYATTFMADDTDWRTSDISFP